MKLLNQAKKYGAVAGVAATSLVATTANAGFLEDAQTAIGTAGTDALTIGGYVVVAIAGLVVVGLAISMIRKI